MNPQLCKFHFHQDSPLWVASEPAMDTCIEELDYDQKSLKYFFSMGWGKEQQN